MNYQELNSIGIIGFRKGGNQMTRSMVVNEEQKKVVENRLGHEVGGLDQVMDEIEDNRPVNMVQRRNRKYSEVGFYQDLGQNMNKSHIVDTRISEPLKFAEKQKVRSPKLKQDINKTVYESNIFESKSDLATNPRPSMNKTNITFNSMLLQKSPMANSRINFKDSPHNETVKGQKKSLSNFINCFTKQASNASDETPNVNLNKFKPSTNKPLAKSSFIFKNKQQVEAHISQSQTHTPITLTPPEQSCTHPFSVSNMKNFYKKISVDDRLQHLSGSKTKQTQTNDGSNIQLTPTQSLRSSIDKLNRQNFYFGKRLGKGKFGEVFLVKHKQSGFLCAMKIIPKKVIVSDKIESQLISQIKINLYLDHPNIVAMYGVFADKQNIYLLLEPCLQGQLYQKIKKSKRLPQKQTSAIVKQICVGVEYLHSEKIIHRDLKPENILLNQGVIKIADLGWAAFHNDQFRQTFCGTPLYLSPQLINQNTYDDKIDNWAIGILTYQMLIGRIPFKISSKQQLQKIVKQQIVFPQHIQISDHAKHFILLMLQRNPNKRPQLQQCFNHPFFA